ncbi:hypothetical protein IFM89_027036, partial [Coptis chinensis]
YLFSGWASIALTTLMIRGCTVPLMINQLKASSKLAVSCIWFLFLPFIHSCIPYKMRPELEEIKDQMQNMISNMAEKVPSFKQGGTFWFTDLTTPDALYIFPIMTALGFLITVEEEEHLWRFVVVDKYGEGERLVDGENKKKEK